MSESVQALAINAVQQDIKRLNMISHNIANANATGFKRQLIIANAGQEQSVTKVLTRAGAVEQTGRNLDFAVAGNYYFAIETEQGVVYTKNGHFKRDESGALVTADGKVVQGVQGKIILPTDDVRVDQQGVIWVDNRAIAQLALVAINNDADLQPLGHARYATQTVRPNSEDPKQVRQGYLEKSNVSIAEEMNALTILKSSFESKKNVINAQWQLLNAAIANVGEL